MSPSGRLCLFITVGLILPTRGQISKEAVTPADPATEIIDVLTPALGEEQGMGPSHHTPPFLSADEDTLRKRGLMVAAVLFITGIVILTSGKCRQLPRLCWNRDR
ncbi:hypothetical protein G4228_002086 [Cervus hanglu yarkandensis]|nr:hypothetical protein G4228_002086 [Cervus hanglu yarkandensis]